MIKESDTAFGCAIDHAISLKHGGSSEVSNLVYACGFCNRYKGSNIGAIFLKTGEFIRFFNPRRDSWFLHFVLNESLIKPRTKIGHVTAQILGFNDANRGQERQILIQLGKYTGRPN